MFLLCLFKGDKGAYLVIKKKVNFDDFRGFLRLPDDFYPQITRKLTDCKMMITTAFYLDTRATSKGAEAPLKIAITRKGSTAYIPLGVSLLPAHWDKSAKKIKGHPRRAFLNTFIIQKKLEIDEIVLRMMKAGGYSRLTVTQIKNKIVYILKHGEEPAETFGYRFNKYIESCSGRTKEIYEATLRRLKAHCPKVCSLSFEDIDVDWLTEFDKFLAKTSPSVNARAIHFRNIRAVFNDAKRNGITSNYPFDKGKFEIRHEKTRKRALPVESLRMIFNANLKDWQIKYRDIFKLIFMLIGINYVDLCRLEKVDNGRIYFKRAKTKRLYSIKVEPEAMSLIEQYRGEHQLLYMLDRSPDYRIAYMQLVKGLNSIKEDLGLEELTTYWARHSWATIASKLGIQKDVIAQALGHGGNTVTDIYIDPDEGLVDEANRKVLDWVLYGKR